MDIAAEIASFVPQCEQEQRDQAQMRLWLNAMPDPFSRENTFAHFTASSRIVSPDRQRIFGA